MQLFYNQDIDSQTSEFTFPKEESKHIIKVLRKKDGDILFVTNGLGYIFESQITLASDSKCTVAVLSVEKKPASEFQLHLAVSPTKMNDRFEWFLEKATEIGIQEITPIICDHSERKVINKERFDKIILTALKQANEVYLPKLNPAITLKEFLKKEYSGQLFIAHCEQTDKKTLQSVAQPKQDTTILIGPEGDFSKKEIDLAIAANFKAVSLGNTRLRTETAALVACHSMVFLNEM
ncbi:16S rRNA (uracil(1498)-N(3))-methyltransferase [Flavobacterium crassostreae]|uniref:Ribosomal RNA small subunit methyltransferase E n=1 Tax=Flavobacterium crassostreae TaxID=1763534 RepID=A0A1B9DYW5_9FLAO|nr:16S rRNA (uracil(1498)-N(3))-methyltransferase [Flavobacterium crassostreae]OCB74881.1 16S rRNA (uracil(1498)-N(3))-methyltransferase [Flavobacterium crassostreae]